MIAGKTVVYTSGTFDMLHANHIKMIEYARSLGDILIVGVNTDELVMSYKSQPIIPFEERIALVKALKYPDIVIPQTSLDHGDKVGKLNFDVFVVGDDWAGKYDYLKEKCVDVVYFPYGRGVSSTNLKERIYENYEKMKNKADSHFPNNTNVKNDGGGYDKLEKSRVHKSSFHKIFFLKENPLLAKSRGGFSFKFASQSKKIRENIA